jgi:hypothetical protein
MASTSGSLSKRSFKAACLPRRVVLVSEVDEGLARFLIEKLSDRRSKMLLPVAAHPFTQENRHVLVSSIPLSAHSIETVSVNHFGVLTVFSV